MSQFLRTEVSDGVAHLILDRPKAINALNQEMIDSATEILQGWALDETTCLEISGEGRGLSAGADIRELAQLVRDGGPWLQFLETEYALFMLVADYPKQTATQMRGVTMGGGLALSCNANRRIVDSTTVMATPETKIGWFPDAGLMFRLSRAGSVGTHVTLTSATFGGGDGIAMNFADESADGDLPAPLQQARVEWMDECYAGDDIFQIMHRLESSDHPDANQAAREIRQRSPFGVTVALRALRRAENLTLAETIHQDLRLSESVIPVDFLEGVRALLIDKDNQPKWRYPTLADVPPSHVDEVFGY